MKIKFISITDNQCECCISEQSRGVDFQSVFSIDDDLFTKYVKEYGRYLHVYRSYHYKDRDCYGKEYRSCHMYSDDVTLIDGITEDVKKVIKSESPMFKYMWDKLSGIQKIRESYDPSNNKDYDLIVVFEHLHD